MHRNCSPAGAQFVNDGQPLPGDPYTPGAEVKVLVRDMLFRAPRILGASSLPWQISKLCYQDSPPFPPATLACLLGDNTPWQLHPLGIEGIGGNAGGGTNSPRGHAKLCSGTQISGAVANKTGHNDEIKVGRRMGHPSRKRCALIGKCMSQYTVAVPSWCVG